MVRVSVVIPAYNASETISKAIDSVHAQTIDDLEILIVDDASTDDTAAVIERYEEPDITYIRHKENKGGSAARNTGIDAAEGEYIAFLDADDEWLHNKLELQLSTLESKPENYIAAHCKRAHNWPLKNQIGYSLARLVGARKPNPPTEGGEELIKEVLLGHLSTGASTLLVDAEAIDVIGGFDTKFPRHQDWEFLIRILEHGKLAYVDQPLVIKHGTGRPSADTYREAKGLLLSKFADKIDELEKQGYPITKKQEFYLAKLYFEDGRFKQGFQRAPIRLNGSDYLSLSWSLCLGLRRYLTTKVSSNSR